MRAATLNKLRCVLQFHAVVCGSALEQGMCAPQFCLVKGCMSLCPYCTYYCTSCTVWKTEHARGIHTRSPLFPSLLRCPNHPIYLAPWVDPPPNRILGDKYRTDYIRLVRNKTLPVCSHLGNIIVAGLLRMHRLRPPLYSRHRPISVSARGRLVALGGPLVASSLENGGAIMAVLYCFSCAALGQSLHPDASTPESDDVVRKI